MEAVLPIERLDMPTIDRLEMKKEADYIMAGTGSQTHRLSIDSIVQAVKKSAGYDRVLEKC